MTETRGVEQMQSWYPPLALLYLGLTLYALTAGIVGVQTLDIVAGEWWELLWPLAMMLCSTTALVGLMLSRTSKHRWVEVLGTLLLIGFFTSYTLALLIRVFTYGNMNALPAAWLPVLISIFPFTRLLWVARKRPAQ